ncbi:hypothetical protein Y032_0021g311 [Ancylostoma ceylanicum]|uniref:Transposable element Tc3 transposase-like DNA-binding HTH domain-containing protein n=1 Tax=Ancylostoma ceylanicum TaxID=53326 RepID=A0A016V050_9BILA|nr:hypothetical protein Y032_0021g311 [Ancylostoma ceylanicum]
MDRFVEDMDAYGERRDLEGQRKRRIGRFVSNSMISTNQVRALLSTLVSKMTVWRSIKWNTNSPLLPPARSQPHRRSQGRSDPDCPEEYGDGLVKALEKMLETSRNSF